MSEHAALAIMFAAFVFGCATCHTADKWHDIEKAKLEQRK